MFFNNEFELFCTLKENHYRLTYVLSRCMSIQYTLFKMSLPINMPHNKMGTALFDVTEKNPPPRF